MTLLCLLGLCGAVVACSDSGPGDGEGGPGDLIGGPGGPGSELPGDRTPDPVPATTVLDEREFNYPEALHTAAMKLLNAPPTLAQIKQVSEATDQKAEYEALLDQMFDDPRFAERMIKWWKDTLRQAGTPDGVDLNSAPTFAARLVVEEKPYTDLFTASSNNCPTYDGTTQAFVDGECNNGAPVQAGVLTNPGSMKQFYANMAFRRVRWIQEAFVCTKFPAEYSTEPQDMGAGQFTSPWDFNSISDTPINFKDTSAVICANCHTTINHVAPLFANFDAEGMWQASSSVMTPTAPDPVTTELSHWLPAGETTAWRVETPVADLAELGQAIANDPDVSECIVARLWNFTMSKEDIVSDLATVPTEVIEPYIGDFVDGGQNMKQTMKAMFKSEDFTKF